MIKAVFAVSRSGYPAFWSCTGESLLGKRERRSIFRLTGDPSPAGIWGWDRRLCHEGLRDYHRHTVARPGRNLHTGPLGAEHARVACLGSAARSIANAGGIAVSVSPAGQDWDHNDTTARFGSRSKNRRGPSTSSAPKNDGNAIPWRGRPNGAFRDPARNPGDLRPNDHG